MPRNMSGVNPFACNFANAPDTDLCSASSGSGAISAQRMVSPLFHASYSSIRLKTIPSPLGRLLISTHSSRVCASAPRTVPMVLAGMPRDRGTLLSVE